MCDSVRAAARSKMQQWSPRICSIAIGAHQVAFTYGDSGGIGNLSQDSSPEHFATELEVEVSHK